VAGDGLPVVRVGVLGLLTIAAYGSWYYSFGVLLDPIIADTGWGETFVTSVFAASIMLGGIGSVLGGLVLDRFGSRSVFGAGAVLGLAAFTIATAASSPWVFAVAAASGGATFAALGFYHITQTVAARISPGAPHRAIAVLTMWGAFASVLYLPVSAWLVGWLGWRTTLRTITWSAVVALLIAAWVVDTRTATMPSVREVVSVLRRAFADRSTRSYVVAVACLGIGIETILVYQVPAMTGAGLALTTASAWAGVRGAAQLGGRLPLAWVVRRVGTVGAQRLAIASMVVGMLALSVAGTPVLAAVYAVFAGVGIGASSPLQGMHAHRLFGDAALGAALGSLSLVFMVGGAIGPAVAGWVATGTGSRSLPVLAAAGVTAMALWFIRPVPDMAGR
jgi:predicted MFS family arabinose efflux permease